MKDIFEDFQEYINEAGRNPMIKSTPNEDEIIKAIEKRKYVGIYYKEEGEEDKIVKSGFRLIEPHVYGKGYKKDNNIVNNNTLYLRAYVIMDSEKDSLAKKKFNIEKGSRRKSVSLSKHRPYWRLFRVDRIQDWTDLKKTFNKLRPSYNPNDKMLVEIIKSVPLNELKESLFQYFDNFINEQKNEIEIGSRVYHYKYGYGDIIDMNVRYNQGKVKVKFDRAGIQSVEYTELELSE